MTTKERVAAVDGWFTLDGADPRLLGNRCTHCGSYFFPKASAFCRNPSCEGTEFEEAPLSNRGTVWSFTTNHYAPPPPYVAADPARFCRMSWNDRVAVANRVVIRALLPEAPVTLMT